MVLLTVFEVCKVQFFEVKVICNGKNLGFYVCVYEEERKDGMKERLCIDSLNTHISVFPPTESLTCNDSHNTTYNVCDLCTWLGAFECLHS